MMKHIGNLIGFACLFFAVYVSIQLNGGIQGTILNLTPPPIRPMLNDQRATTVEEINNEHEVIKNQNRQFKYYDKTEHDYCERGQNSFKVHDGYANRCTYRVSYFYGFSGDFKQTLLDFENYLGMGNWIFEPDFRIVPPEDPNTKPIERDLKFYDEGNNPNKPRFQNFPNGVLVSDLGPFSIHKKNEARLDLVYAEQATKDMFYLEHFQEVNRKSVSVIYETKRFLDAKKIFKKIISDNKYLIMISIEKVYFEN